MISCGSIMASHTFNTKSSLKSIEPWVTQFSEVWIKMICPVKKMHSWYVQSRKCIRNTCIICKMAAILFRPQCGKHWRNVSYALTHQFNFSEMESLLSLKVSMPSNGPSSMSPLIIRLSPWQPFHISIRLYIVRRTTSDFTGQSIVFVSPCLGR